MYFFTAQTQNGYLIYYMGETGITFIERLGQHRQSYLIGQYHIYEAQSFSNCVKHLVFDGWINKKPKKQARIEYLNAIEEYRTKMFEFINCMKIFLLQVEPEKRIIERIEAGIHLHVKKKPSPVGTFENGNINISAKKEERKAFDFKNKRI